MLQPTFHGYIGSTEDAVLVIQAVLNNELQPVSRRIDPRERSDRIVLGNVFVFIEETSQIRRWTDGKMWSASRILGRFLMYRELDKNNPHASLARGKRKKKNSMPSILKDRPALTIPRNSLLVSNFLSKNFELDIPQDYSDKKIWSSPHLCQGTDMMDIRKGYIPCPAKSDSKLIKKTISFTIPEKDKEKATGKRTVHLVSYFAPKDVVNSSLLRPTASKLADTSISPELQSAVTKALRCSKPAPIDLEIYFLDSRYQLLKFSTSSRSLPLLKYGPTPDDTFHKDQRQRNSIPLTETQADVQVASNKRYFDLENGMDLSNIAGHDNSLSAPRIPSEYQIMGLNMQSMIRGSVSGGSDIYAHKYLSSASSQISESQMSKPVLQTLNSSSSDSSHINSQPSYLRSNSHPNQKVLMTPMSMPLASQQNHPLLPSSIPHLQGIGQTMYSLHQDSFGDQASAQSSFSTPFLTPSLSTCPPSSGSPHQEPSNEKQVLMQTKMGPDYQISNLPSVFNPSGIAKLTSSGAINSYFMGYEQNYPLGMYHTTGYDHSDVPFDQRQDFQATFNPRIDSSLSFEYPQHLYRSSHKLEDLDVG